MTPQHYSIVATSKGSSTSFSLNDHYEILVRLVLNEFAKDPVEWNIKNIAMDNAHKPGFMGKGPQFLMTSEITKLMSKNKSISDSLSNIRNHLKEKIKNCCVFTSNFQRKLMTEEFKENLRRCLDMDIPLRLYQMENMVARSDDGFIRMNGPQVALRDRHRSFAKESSNKYIYQRNDSKTSHYLFSFFEIICYQCGFFTWEDISKY
jgi:hypothetical protein